MVHWSRQRTIGGDMSRLLAPLILAALAGCASIAPDGKSYLQMKDPVSGVLLMEIAMADGRGCPGVAAEISGAAKGVITTCVATSSAGALPYRMTARSTLTDQLQDFHFITMTVCTAAQTAPKGYKVVTDCAGK
jgi:hypothetical protein